MAVAQRFRAGFKQLMFLMAELNRCSVRHLSLPHIQTDLFHFKRSYSLKEAAGNAGRFQ